MQFLINEKKTFFVLDLAVCQSVGHVGRWWYRYKKCSSVLGTTSNEAFHVSLMSVRCVNPQPSNASPSHPATCSSSHSDSSGQYLPLQIFSDILPYYCIPMWLV